MKLKELIKNLFNKNKIKSITDNTTTLSPYDVSEIEIPLFNSLNKLDREKVLLYKNEIDTNNLESIINYNRAIATDAEQVTNLLVKYIYELNEAIRRDDKTNKELNEIYVNLSLKNIKVIVLNNYLKELKQDAFLKAIAISMKKEEYEKRKYQFVELFSRASRIKRNDKIRSLTETETRTKITIKTLEQLIKASVNSINSNNTLVNTIDIYNNLINKVENQEIRKEIYRKKLEYYTKLNNLYFENTLPNIDKLQDLLDNYNSLKEVEIIYLIATIEVDLDKFIYNNKIELIHKFRSELEKLEDIKISEDNKEDILSKINKLELIIEILKEFIKKNPKEIVFPYFDKNFIYDGEIRELFELKFAVLTVDINELGYSPINSENKYEYEVYQEIINEKIRKINNGETIETKKIKELGMLKQLLKTFNKELNLIGKRIEIILTSGYFIAFILAFDKENGLTNFFKEYKFGVNSYKNWIKLYNYVQLEDELSIETICTLIEYELKEKQINNCPEFYKLYRLIKDIGNQEDIYYIPEGIKTIAADFGYSRYQQPLLKNIRENAENKIVVFPSTLKEIKGMLLDNHDNSYQIKGINLNRKLERFDLCIIDRQKLDNFTFPSTLKKISGITAHFDFSNIKVLSFENFKQSKILYNLFANSDSQDDILGYLFIYEEHKMSGFIYHKVYPLVQEFVLYDDNDEYHITKKELTFEFTSEERIPFYKYLKILKANVVNLIEQKTGYRIENIEEDNKKLIK